MLLRNVLHQLRSELRQLRREPSLVWREVPAHRLNDSGAQLARVADIAMRPGTALGLARRHIDALRATLSGDATAEAVLALVDERCGTATDAASDELRGRLVAALGAMARGAGAEAETAAAERRVGTCGPSPTCSLAWRRP